MKTSDLSVKPLAAFIGVSTDTIRRAVGKGEIPATNVVIALRFDLHKVLHQMERNTRIYLGRGSASAPGGIASRVLADEPPFGNAGTRIAERSRQDLRRSHERSRGYDDHPYPHKDT